VCCCAGAGSEDGLKGRQRTKDPRRKLEEECL
jgi:hypothetical protein